MILRSVFTIRVWFACSVPCQNRDFDNLAHGLFSRVTYPHMFIMVYFQRRPAHTLTRSIFMGDLPSHSHWSIFTGDLPTHVHPIGKVWICFLLLLPPPSSFFFVENFLMVGFSSFFFIMIRFDQTFHLMLSLFFYFYFCDFTGLIFVLPNCRVNICPS